MGADMLPAELLREYASIPGQALIQIVVGQQANHRLSQSSNLAEPIPEPVVIVSHSTFRHPVAGDDRDATSVRLEHYDAKPLARRRHHHQTGALQEISLLDLVEVEAELDIGLEA